MRHFDAACKACGGFFDTGIAWAAYGRPVFAPVPRTCPSCHVVAEYGSVDLVEGAS